MRVMLVGSQYFVDESIQGLRNQPRIRVIGSADDPTRAASMAAEMEPNVIVVDEAMEDALRLAGRLSREAPGAAVFLATVRPSVDIARQAAAHGVSDTIRKPLDGFELARAAELARDGRRPSRRQGDPGHGGSGEAEARGGNGPSFLQQEVVAVHSPKGGVGKTTVAVNLAAALMRAGGRGTRGILIDFDPYGNVVGMIPLEGSATVTDWIGLDHVLGREETEALTCLHRQSGLRVIPSPRSMEDADAVDAGTAKTILEAARQHFDVVVVDCGPRVMDAQLVALDHATRILEIGIMEVPTLRSLNDFRTFMEARLGIDQAKVRCVLNRVPRRPDLPMWEVANMLPWPLVAKIPEDPAVPQAANRSEVLVLSGGGRSPFAQEIRRLAEATAPTHPQPRAGGLLGRLFGRR